MVLFFVVISQIVTKEEVSTQFNRFLH